MGLIILYSKKTSINKIVGGGAYYILPKESKYKQDGGLIKFFPKKTSIYKEQFMLDALGKEPAVDSYKKDASSID